MDSSQTNVELLVQVKRLTGLTVRMLPYEEVLEIKTVGNTVAVLIQTYQYRERRADVEFTARGKRLVSLTHKTDGTWTHDQMVVWEPDFVPFYQNTFGPGKTVGDWYAQRTRERMAYRPGTSTSPMDNSDRTHMHDGNYSPPRMRSHWK